MSKTENIKKLYAEIEKKYDYDEINFDEFLDDIHSEEEKSIIGKERWILSTNSIYHGDAIDSEELVEYMKSRLGHTSNIFLLSRYNHVLYNLTKNNEYCKNAIENYKAIARQYFESNDSNIGYRMHIVLNTIICLSKKIKLDLLDIEKAINNYLKSNNICDDIKFWILDSIKDNYDKWKIKSITYAPEICMELYSHEAGYGKCKSILEIGEFFAQRFNKAILPIIYDCLGENEGKCVIYDDGNNITASHYNQYTYQRMMRYYKMSGNVEKLRNATIKYNECKVGMKFVKFEDKKQMPKEIIDYLQRLFCSVESSEPDQILYLLSSHFDLFYPPNSKLNEMWKDTESKDYFHIKCMRAVRSDINNNVTEITHEDNCKFLVYNTFLSNSMKWIIHILALSIEKKKLSYSLVKSILIKRTNFGNEIIFYRNGNQLIYRWFDKIDFALKDFFIQCNKEMVGKKSDWRNVITNLAIQFEGILRDSIRVYNGENSKIVGNNKEKVVEMLLDDLLRTNACKELFTEEDRNLFYYTFTNKGLNIRNYVAHGFYMPQDYSTYNAILVFLCVLRLVRFEK